MSKIECDTEEALQALKEKAMKSKVISLDRMGKHPLMNPKMFSNRERTQLISQMTEIFNDWDAEKIDKEFAEIVNERLLANGLDYQQYPVYNLTPTPPSMPSITLTTEE